MEKSIRVFAPATVANVSCGFDICGFALTQPGDLVEMTLLDTPGVKIIEITGDDGKLPLDPTKNTAGVSVLAFLKALQLELGVEIRLHKKMPQASGLGSSAASAVASVYALNCLLQNPYPLPELIPFAMAGEQVACGEAHADNVAPSLLGGFVVIRSYDPLEVFKIPTPKDLWCTILHPHFELQTELARKILPQSIPLKSAIQQWGNVAGLITGLIQADYGLIKRSLIDVVAEPVRSPLIPGFAEIKAAVLKCDVLGCGISGAGPSLFILSLGRHNAQLAGEAASRIVQGNGDTCDIYLSPINEKGPVIR